MTIISVTATGYILSLVGDQATPSIGAPPPELCMGTLAAGLALVSFWTREEVTRAFTEANRLWRREASIHFSPLNISERTEVVPADPRAMQVRLINRLLSPASPGVAVAFVYDLGDAEGGWAEGRVAAISGEKTRSSNPLFAGHILAHELGHLLIGDPFHGTAQGDPHNLMYRSRTRGAANAGFLNSRQVELARAGAARLQLNR